MADAAQYAIEIAATMSGGDHTAAELDKLTEKLVAGGKRSEDFSNAITDISNKLTAAKAAQAAASDALSEGTAKYKELEKAALQTAKAAEKAALKNAGVVPPELAAEADKTTQALKKQAEAVKLLEAESAKHGAEVAKQTHTLGNLREMSAHVDKGFTENAEGLSKIQAALHQVPGPVGEMAAKFVDAKKGMGELNSVLGEGGAQTLLLAVGAAAAVAAVVALTAAIVAGTVAIAAWAVGLADVNRNYALADKAAEAMHPELVKLEGAFASLHDETGLYSDKLTDLEKKLRAAHVSARDMPQALRAAALAESALGQGGVDDFFTRLEQGRQSVSALSNDISTKLAPIVAQKMMSLDAQTQKFHENIAGIFGGLNIDPVLKGLQRLVALFDENTVAGKTIKFLFEKIFQPLIDQADKASVYIEAFVLGVLIGMVKIYIALKPAIKYFEQLFGFNDNTSSDTLATLTAWGEKAADVFAAMAAVFGVVAGAVAATVAQFVAMYAVGAYLVAEAIKWTASFVSLGGQMMAGLAHGITGAAGAVLDAIKGAVNGAIDAAKNMLGIHSPSKVFAGIGDNTVAGYVNAVDAGADDAASATQAMVAPPPVVTQGAFGAMSPAANAVTNSAASSSSDAAASKGGGSSLNFQGATFNFYGVEGAEDAEARFGQMLTRFVEGDVEQAGRGGKAAA